jgi:hypothetical protein
MHKVPVSAPLLWLTCAHSHTRHDPLYATFLLLGILGTFKPYPTLSDPGLFLSLISLFPEVHPCACAPVPCPTDTERSPMGRSPLPGRNCASAPTRLSPPPTFPPFVDRDWHRQRKFLLCEHACVRSRQWLRTLRLRLGRPPRRYR